MMLDGRDRELLLLWAVRVMAVVVAVLGSAVTLGLAWRAFELVRG